jgi:hypothetical protein
METIAIRMLEKHVRQLVASMDGGSEGVIALRLLIVKDSLEALDAIRKVDEATDVTDAENPLIRKHND